MEDLSGRASVPASLPMPDADVVHLGRLALPHPNDVVLHRLIAETAWRADRITVWGKSFPQPRLTAWHGDKRYTYSGITLTPAPWTTLLLDIRHAVEQAAQQSFNTVLLNYYRNERDSMGFHSDDEAELGTEPVIASLSLGAARDFVFKHKYRKDLKPYRVLLENGTLIVMRGQTQRHWLHGIEKRTRSMGPRVNLTFRTIY